MRVQELFTILSLLVCQTFAQSYLVQRSLPGWQLGTNGAPLKIRLFYDLLCPDSKADHYAWQKLFAMPSPIPGKTYHDIVDMEVVAFVLPYHDHSF